MTTATIDKNATKTAKVTKTEAVAVVVDPTPKPTGFMGGAGEFLYWPELNVYAAMEAGKPHAFQLTPDMWEMMKPGLVPVTAVKAQVAKAALAAAKATVYQYTITCAIVFESTEQIDPATELTWETIVKMAEDHGFTDKLASFKLHPGKKSGGGGTRSPQGDGTASGFVLAKDETQLKPLSESERLVALAMQAEGTCAIALSRWEEFGYKNLKGFTDSAINWKRKGYKGAVSTEKNHFVLKPQLMYPGFDIQDALAVKKA